MRGKFPRNWIILGAIVLLAAFLRLPFLTVVPPGLTPDEAAQGYTAYSLLKTGKDEWEQPWPLNLRSFGDFKPPLYTYLLIPSVAIFGLNELAVRLPAAIIGISAVVVTYYLSHQLFKDEKLAYLSSAFLAISPWHIQLSRGGFEAGLLVFLIPLGIYGFLVGKEKPIWLIIAAVSFALSLFTYHSAKLIVPLLVGMLGVAFWRQLMKNKNYFLVSLSILAVSLVLLFMGGWWGKESRVADISIFNPTDKFQGVFEKRVEAVRAGLSDPFARVFNNKLTYLVETFSENYLEYFSFNFLFSDGPAEGFYGMSPGIGVLYLFDLPLLPFAIYKIVQKREKGGILLLFIVLISPLPAALTKGPGYAANRAVVMLPFLVILSAYGLRSIGNHFLKLTIGGLIILSLPFFAEKYFFHSRYVIAAPMQYGWKQAMAKIEEREDRLAQIIISRRFSEPQAYVMFYKTYDPGQVQEASPAWLAYEKQGLPFLDQLGEYSLGKYVFRNFHYPVDRQLEKTILVGKKEDFPATISPNFVINYPNGQPAIYLVESDK